MEQVYFTIDLKTFFASCELVERNLDPFKTNLVVADVTRGKNAICLAISPYMKMQGVKNRCRIQDIPKHINYLVARPRMSLYEDYSKKIYKIYLKYFSKDDIYQYSIDEAFIYVSPYLKLYNMKKEQLAKRIIDDILNQTNITATCGIGENLFQSKVALDIISKHTKDNIGIVNSENFRDLIGSHKPIYDIWHIGKNIAKRLEKYNCYNLNDVSDLNRQILINEFGVIGNYIYDHSLGIEPTTIKMIKEYKPKANSISIGHTLFKDYTYESLKVVIKELVGEICLKLAKSNLKTKSIALFVMYKDQSGYSKSKVLSDFTNSNLELEKYFLNLYLFFPSDKLIRKISLGVSYLIDKDYIRPNLFSKFESNKEFQINNLINEIKMIFGKNALLKAIDLDEDAIMIEKNLLNGGHNEE